MGTPSGVTPRLFFDLSCFDMRHPILTSLSRLVKNPKMKTGPKKASEVVNPK